MSAGEATALRRVGWLALALVLAAPFGLAIRDDLLAHRAAAAEATPDQPAPPPATPGMDQRFFSRLGDRPRLLGDQLADVDDVRVVTGDRYADAESLQSGTTLVFPDDGRAERELGRRWGEPHRAVDRHDIARSFWFDREAGIRAILESTEGRARLDVRRYQRFDRLVAELRDELTGGGPEPAPAAAGGDAGAGQPAVGYSDQSYPPAEFSDAVTEVRRWRTGTRLDAVEVEVDFVYDPDWGERAVAELTRAYGAPERDPGGRLLYGGSPRMIVVADRTIGRLSVEIRR